MLEGGMPVTAAMRQIGVHHSTFSHLQSQFEAVGSLKDRHRTGRPRKTSAAEDRYIVMTSCWNCFMSARKVADQLRAATRTRISAQTVRRLLYRGRLRARRPYIGIPLARCHRQDQVNWAINHRLWNQVIGTISSLPTNLVSLLFRRWESACVEAFR